MKKGFTLLELMMVVAIIGALSALSASSIVKFARLGRVNGAAGMLARAMGAARVRAVTQQCMHFVQVNGPSYTASPVTDVSRAARISIVRKGLCDPAAVVPAVLPVLTYEPALDTIVDYYTTQDDLIDLQFTGAGMPGPLVAGSVLIAYDRFGRRLEAVDPAGAGFADVSVPGAITLSISPHDPELIRTVTIPTASSPTTD